MHKVIILVLGCQESTDPFFRREYEECCKKTWMTNLPNDWKVIYYQGGTETKLEDDILTVACEDGFDTTYRKFYLALDYLRSNFEYDFIFRTNPSTYINTKLLEVFIDKIYNRNYYYGSDIYSLSEACAPYPLSQYRRGNGILLSNYDIDILLTHGIPLLYQNICDDIAIDNILNSYKIMDSIKHRIPYQDNHRGIPHSWFECIDNDFNNGHRLSTFKTSNFYNITPTITIKKYHDRDKEFNHYFKCHEMVRKLDILGPEEIKLIEEYSKNYDIFIGSILGYISKNKWENLDKNILYLIEITNKASDDEQYQIYKEIQGKFGEFEL